MEIKAKPPLMLSKALEERLSEEQLDQQQTSIIIAVILFMTTDNRLETVVGSTVSYSIGDEISLETRVPMQDLFDLTVALDLTNAQQTDKKIQIIGFELHLDQDIYKIPGPFKILELKTNDYDIQRQTGVLGLKLRRI